MDGETHLLWKYGRASATECRWLKLWSLGISPTPSSRRGVPTQWWGATFGTSGHSKRNIFSLYLQSSGDNQPKLPGRDPRLVALQQEHLQLLHLHQGPHSVQCKVRPAAWPHSTPLTCGHFQSDSSPFRMVPSSLLPGPSDSCRGRLPPGWRSLPVSSWSHTMASCCLVAATGTTACGSLHWSKAGRWGSTSGTWVSRTGGQISLPQEET